MTGATAARTTGVGVLGRGLVKIPCGTCWKTCGITGGTKTTTGVVVGVAVGVTVGVTVASALTTRVAVAGPPGGDSVEVTVLVVFTYVFGIVELTETTI
jgi:hypothetical protein